MDNPNMVQAGEEGQNLGEALQAMVDHAQEVLHWGSLLGVQPQSGGTPTSPPPKPPVHD